MRISFFTTGMTRGGAERVIATLANRLVADGQEVSIVMLKGEGSEYGLDERVRLVTAGLQAGLRNAPAALSFYRHTISEISPDVVISFTLKPNVMACLARRWFGIGVPLIVSERANPFQRSLSRQLMCNNLFGYSDAIVCQSKVIACYYEGRVKGVPVAVIPNPIDSACIAESPAGERSEYLLSVGRLCQQKRQDLAIRALAELKESYPSLRLEVCGVGDDLESLQSLAEQLGVGNIVSFCGNVENVMRAKADAAAYLMTSDYEGFPNALIEALASGIPVVSTDFSPGIARELVRDGLNGFVVPAGDTHAIAAAASRILVDPPSDDALANSVDAIRNRFDLDTVVDQWMRICEQVAGKNG